MAIAVADPFGSTTPSKAGVIDNTDPTSLATVNQQSLSSETQVDATLGYAGTYSVVNQAQGTITPCHPSARWLAKARAFIR